MAKRTRISDEQRGILERFFEGGMVGTGTMYKEMVLKASTGANTLFVGGGGPHEVSINRS